VALTYELQRPPQALQEDAPRGVLREGVKVKTAYKAKENQDQD